MIRIDLALDQKRMTIVGHHLYMIYVQVPPNSKAKHGVSRLSMQMRMDQSACPNHPGMRGGSNVTQRKCNTQ